MCAQCELGDDDRMPVPRNPRVLVAGPLVGIMTIAAAALVYKSLDFSSPTGVVRITPTMVAPTTPPSIAAPSISTAREPSRELGAADGAIPEHTTVYDNVPGVAKLDAALLGALRRAATDAARNGIELTVESGWRSTAYQQQLLREAVVKYGSAAEAARWVAPPNRSAHVSGDAVDVASSDAIAWLSRHGADYGLCQIYDNEPWHYELRPSAIGDGCPARFQDTTHDPRMQP
jgi:hypothetical protein